MPIKFACSTCGKKLGVADHLAGRRGKCPDCGELFTVPSPDAPPPPPPRVMRQDDTDYHVAIDGPPERGSSLLPNGDAAPSPDLLFGRLAVKAGYLTEEQVEDLVRQQEQSARAGVPVTLGEICQMERLLTSQQVQRVLQGQEFALIRGEAKRLGALAVRNGLATEADISSAMGEQTRIYKEERRVPPKLGEILVGMGVLSGQQLRALLSAQGRLTGGKEEGAGEVADRKAATPPKPSASTMGQRPSGWLVLETGDGAGRRIPLGRKAILGRQPENEVPVEDDQASRQHARIEYIDLGGQHVLTDLNSRNGTLLNGETVVEPTALNAGDRIQIGEAVYRYEAAASVDAAPADETRVAPPTRMGPQLRRETVARPATRNPIPGGTTVRKDAAAAHSAMAQSAPQNPEAMVAPESPAPPVTKDAGQQPAPVGASRQGMDTFRRRMAVLAAGILLLLSLGTGAWVWSRRDRGTRASTASERPTAGRDADNSPVAAPPALADGQPGSGAEAAVPPPAPGSAVESAMARLRSPDPLDRLHAVQDLGNMGSTALPAVPELCRLLSAQAEDVSVREAAALNVSLVDRGMGASLHAVLEASKDKNERVRLASVRAAYHVEVWNADVCARLGEALLDPSPEVANEAVQDLELAAASEKSQSPSPFSGLARGLESAETGMFAKCLRGIGDRLSWLSCRVRGANPSTGKAELEAWQSDLASTIQAVTQRIPGVGADRDAVVSRLTDAMLAGDYSGGFAAATLLAALDPLPAEALTEGLKSKDTRVRQSCLRALRGVRPAPDAVLQAALALVEGDPFRLHLLDGDEQCADALRLLLANRPASIPELGSLLRLQVRSGSKFPDPGGKSSGVIALVLVACDAPGLAELDRALQDGNSDARCLAAWAQGFANGTVPKELDAQLKRDEFAGGGGARNDDPWWTLQQAPTEDSIRTAVAALFRAYQDDDEHVRQQALAALERLESGTLPKDQILAIKKAVAPTVPSTPRGGGGSSPAVPPAARGEGGQKGADGGKEVVAAFLRMYGEARKKHETAELPGLLEKFGRSAEKGEVPVAEGIAALQTCAAGEKDSWTLHDILAALGAFRDPSTVKLIERISSPYVEDFVRTSRPVAPRMGPMDEGREKENHHASDVVTGAVAGLGELHLPESVDLLLKYAGQVHKAVPAAGPQPRELKPGGPEDTPEREADSEQCLVLDDAEGRMCIAIRKAAGLEKDSSVGMTQDRQHPNVWMPWGYKEWATWWAKNRPKPPRADREPPANGAAGGSDPLAAFRGQYARAREAANPTAQRQALQGLLDSIEKGQVAASPGDAISALQSCASGETDPEVLALILRGLGGVQDVAAVGALERTLSPFVSRIVHSSPASNPAAPSPKDGQGKGGSFSGAYDVCLAGAEALSHLRFPESVDLLVRFSGQAHGALPNGGRPKDPDPPARKHKGVPETPEQIRQDVEQDAKDQEAFQAEWKKCQAKQEWWDTIHRVELAFCGAASGVTGQKGATLDVPWGYPEWKEWWAKNCPADSPSAPSTARSGSGTAGDESANRMLTVAQGFETNKRADLAIQKYQDIVDKYPGTEAAAKAKVRIEALRNAAPQDSGSPDKTDKPSDQPPRAPAADGNTVAAAQGGEPGEYVGLPDLPYVRRCDGLLSL